MRPLSRDTGARRRDPAPSRWAYRLNRLWLTPLFRRLVLRGLPALLLAGLLGSWLAEPAALARLRAEAEDLRRAIAMRPELLLREAVIEGASPELRADIVEVMAVDFPVSSLDLDLEALRLVIEGLDPVASVRLRALASARLHVHVVARRPAVIWRRDDGLELLDLQGRRVMALETRAARPDLGLIAGEGADAAVPEALALMRAARPLVARLRGLERIGARRWDVVLDRGQRILLPEDGAVRALERTIALDEARGLLARDVLSVDLRDPERPVLRLAPAAQADLSRMTSLSRGDDA